MKRTSLGMAALAGAAALGCATTSFVSSWKAPDATPLQVKGAKVVAVAMFESESARRVAEDTIARELSERGAVGMPMYKILPDKSPESERQARDALEGQDVAGVVVMRPIATDKKIVISPGAYTGRATARTGAATTASAGRTPGTCISGPSPRSTRTTSCTWRR